MLFVTFLLEARLYVGYLAKAASSDKPTLNLIQAFLALALIRRTAIPIKAATSKWIVRHERRHEHERRANEPGYLNPLRHVIVDIMKKMTLR